MTRPALLLSLAVALLGCTNVVLETDDVMLDDEVEVAVATEALHRERNVLRSKKQVVQWQGSVGPEDAPTGGEPPECAEVPCDHFKLKIDLPRNTFTSPNRPGGVQVAVRWFGNPGPHTLPPGVPGCCGEFDTLHLWVYKDGELRAASPASSRCAVHALAEPGERRLRRVDRDDLAQRRAFVEYEGWRGEYARDQPAAPHPPDLTSAAPSALRSRRLISHLRAGAPRRELLHQRDEEDGAQTATFDQSRNEARPARAWLLRAAREPQEEGMTYECAERSPSDGSFEAQAAVKSSSRRARQPLSSFASSELWASNARRPISASAVSEGEGQLCIADIRTTPGQKSDGPRTYYAPPACSAASDAEADPTPGIQRLGRHLRWYIPTVPRGQRRRGRYYRLEFCADPDNSIEEEDEAQLPHNHVRRAAGHA